jgi:hypothetical protein
MDAYHTMNAAGARGAPTPSDMAAMGYHKATKQIEEAGMASQPVPNRLANLRSIWKIEN